MKHVVAQLYSTLHYLNLENVRLLIAATKQHEGNCIAVTLDIVRWSALVFRPSRMRVVCAQTWLPVVILTLLNRRRDDIS
jgi:hypothetical protein